MQFPAYNVGSPIRYDSVSREAGLNKNTVADHITLFEQCFIVKVCPSYAKNLANELKKSKKKFTSAITGFATPFRATYHR